MVNEFVVQVSAGAAVAVLGGVFVALRQRAKGISRPPPLVAFFVVGALVIAAVFGTYLTGMLAGAPWSDAPASASALPVVSRIEGTGIDRRRGFFTPLGYLVAPARDMPIGMTVSASWGNAGGAMGAQASVSRLGGCEGTVAILRVDTAPRAAHPIGDSQSLRPGDAVTRFVPNEPAPGRVVAVGASRGGGGCAWLVTTRLNNSHLAYPGDAGAPVLDAGGRVVAMIAMNDVERGETWSIPIEHIREEFPWAFENPAHPDAA